MVDIDDTNRPKGFDPYFAFARQTPAGLVEYYDRPAIESQTLYHPFEAGLLDLLPRPQTMTVP